MIDVFGVTTKVSVFLHDVELRSKDCDKIIC